MALYIDPPSGIVQLGRLERYARTRLAFLLKVARCHGNAMLLRDVMTECAAMEAADCLIEGSKKDEISHFLLRLEFCSLLHSLKASKGPACYGGGVKRGQILHHIFS